MIRRRGGFVPALLAFVLAAAACSSGASQSPSAPGGAASGSPAASGSAAASGGAASMAATGDLNVMGFGCTKGDDIATNRIKAFQAAYPNVNLKCTEGDLNDQVFLTAVRSGTPP